MTDDIIVLETAALQRDTEKIFQVLSWFGYELRGAEALVKVQRDGLSF
jgi:hypothetical protein